MAFQSVATNLVAGAVAGVRNIYRRDLLGDALIATPVCRPGRSGQGDPPTLSAQQLLINQRIDQAAIRRATGITNRLNAGLTGGDVRAAQVVPRISQAGVRNANALIRRLETGLSGTDLRPGTLTAADLG